MKNTKGQKGLVNIRCARDCWTRACKTQMSLSKRLRLIAQCGISCEGAAPVNIKTAPSNDLELQGHDERRKEVEVQGEPQPAGVKTRGDTTSVGRSRCVWRVGDHSTKLSKIPEELLDSLKEGVQSILNDKDWAGFLNVMRKIHHYSFNNRFLIALEQERHFGEIVFIR